MVLKFIDDDNNKCVNKSNQCGNVCACTCTCVHVCVEEILLDGEFTVYEVW